MVSSQSKFVDNLARTSQWADSLIVVFGAYVQPTTTDTSKNVVAETESLIQFGRKKKLVESWHYVLYLHVNVSVFFHSWKSQRYYCIFSTCSTIILNRWQETSRPILSSNNLTNLSPRFPILICLETLIVGLWYSRRIETWHVLSRYKANEEIKIDTHVYIYTCF